MSRKQVLAALAFAVVGTAAFAQEAPPDTWMHAAPGKSRDEVRAELAQARTDGTLQKMKLGYIDRIQQSTTSRDQVRAQALAARRSGEQHTIDSEAYAFVPSGASLTRLAQSF